MAKKKNRGKNRSKPPADTKSNDEILEDLAEDVGANEDESERTVADSSPPAALAAAAKKAEEESEEEASEEEEEEELDEDEDEDEDPVVPDAPEQVRGERASKAPKMRYWPVDDDHASAAAVLRAPSDASDVDLSADVAAIRGTKTNLSLVLSILICAGAGIYVFNDVASQEALDRKAAEREAAEKAHMEEQLAKQKKYGILKVESIPEQAVLLQKDAKTGQWAPIMAPDPTDPEPDVAKKKKVMSKTPVTMMNLDIAPQYAFRVEMDGFEPVEFNVAQHLWTKDMGSGEYKFYKREELIPNACEYYFLYDMKRRREVKCHEKEECETYQRDALASSVSVTDCTCKGLPEDLTLEDWRAKEEERKKKGKTVYKCK